MATGNQVDINDPSQWEADVNDASQWETGPVQSLNPTEEANKALKRSSPNLSVSEPGLKKPPVSPVLTPLQQGAQGAYLGKYGVPPPKDSEMVTGVNEPAAQMTQGVNQLGTPGQKRRGVTNIVQGALGHLSGPENIGPAIATAPVAFPVAVGAGNLGKTLTRSVAKGMFNAEDDTADLLGEGAGLASGMLGAKVGEGLGAGMRDSFGKRFNPVETAFAGLKPANNRIRFMDNLRQALNDIKHAETQRGHGIGTDETGADKSGELGTGINDFLALIKQAKEGIWAERQAAAGPAAQINSTRNGRAIGQAMIDSIPEKIRSQDPQGYMRIVKKAQGYDRDFNVQQLEDWLHTANGEIDQYLDAFPDKQRGAALRHPKVASLNAEVAGIRRTLYSMLDDVGQPGVARELSSRYGKLMEVEQAATRRKNVFLRQQPQSLSEQMAGWHGLGEVGRGLWDMASGNFVGGASRAVKGMAEPAAARWLRDQQSTDKLLLRAVRNHEPTTDPITVPRGPQVGDPDYTNFPDTRRWHGTARPQLEQTRRMGPVPDPSGSTSWTGPHPPPNPLRQVESGPVPPPRPMGPIPDPSGSTSWTGPPPPPNPLRQLESGPTPTPTRIAPLGGTPTGTVVTPPVEPSGIVSTDTAQRATTGRKPHYTASPATPTAPKPSEGKPYKPRWGGRELTPEELKKLIEEAAAGNPEFKYAKGGVVVPKPKVNVHVKVKVGVRKSKLGHRSKRGIWYGPPHPPKPVADVPMPRIPRSK